jgi:NAD(P)H dehydrogenase (quinone)
MNKITVIIGHPFADSFSHVLAARYIETAQTSGAEVRVIDLASVEFALSPKQLNDVRVRGIDSLGELDASIAHMVLDMDWADHFAFFYPVWWGTYPAVLKAFIDRTIISGVAFQYGKTGTKWNKIWRGKTARLVLTMDAPPWWYRLVYRAPGENSLKWATLWYVGVKTTGISRFAPVRFSSPQIRQKWLTAVERLGRKDA